MTAPANSLLCFQPSSVQQEFRVLQGIKDLGPDLIAKSACSLKQFWHGPVSLNSHACARAMSPAGGIRGPVIMMRRRQPGLAIFRWCNRTHGLPLDIPGNNSVPLLGFQEVSCESVTGLCEICGSQCHPHLLQAGDEVEKYVFNMQQYTLARAWQRRSVWSLACWLL
jgi:hypothetical protein